MGALPGRCCRSSHTGGCLIEQFGTFIGSALAAEAVWTVVGAMLAVFGGIGLFHYQQWQNEKKLKKKLVGRVAVELKDDLELLEGKAHTFCNSETEEPLGPPVVLATLSTTALSDWMRSNVAEPEDVRDAMKREGFINAHNKQVEVLLSQWGADTRGLAHGDAFRTIISLVAQRQQILRAECTYELRRLRAEDVEVPDYPAKRLSGKSEPAECRNCGTPLDVTYTGPCPNCGGEAGKIIHAGK